MKIPILVKHKKVLIFGLGLQGGGVGDALWLHRHKAEVRVTDLKSPSQLAPSLAKLPTDITTTLGRHQDSDIDWADLIIKNPGVPNDHPQLLYARQRQVPVYTSIALVVQALRDKTIGITGTRGKTTTTELIYALLSSAYPNQVLRGGNLAGTSAFALLDSAVSAKYLVLELSSFQLAGLHDLHTSPKIAVLTNIFPDHLNRYPSMTEYAHDKSAIFAYHNSRDLLFFNRDNQSARDLAQKAPSRKLPFSAGDLPADWKLCLPGQHNRTNAAAAYLLANELGLDPDKSQVIIQNFRSIPYRLETVAELNNIRFINDTTSTTPIATMVAIKAMDRPTILIIGGDNKNLPFDELILLLSASPQIKHIIVLGSKNIPAFVHSLAQAVPDKIHTQVFSMHEAVEEAIQIAKPGDSILLSPGFASFDLFDNEFDRGRQFNQAISSLFS